MPERELSFKQVDPEDGQTDPEPVWWSKYAVLPSLLAFRTVKSHPGHPYDMLIGLIVGLVVWKLLKKCLPLYVFLFFTPGTQILWCRWHMPVTYDR